MLYLQDLMRGTMYHHMSFRAMDEGNGSNLLFVSVMCIAIYNGAYLGCTHLD